jgi:hypothetical protein
MCVVCGGLCRFTVSREYGSLRRKGNGVYGIYIVLLSKMNILNGTGKQTLVTAWEGAAVKYSRGWQTLAGKAAQI